MFFLRNILKFTHINVMLYFLNFFVIPYLYKRIRSSLRTFHVTLMRQVGRTNINTPHQ